MNEPLRNLMKNEIEELKREAYQKGQAQMLDLFRKPIEGGRKNDVERAVRDDAFCSKLMSEFGLADGHSGV